MKKSELKNLIKPIIKECIQESLLEDGILSKVISEVVMGLNSTNNIVREEKKIQHQQERSAQGKEGESLRNLKEQRQQMLDAIGGGNYNGVNLFEGTDPLTNGGQPGGIEAPSSALSGIDPKDSGVDISSLVGTFGTAWRSISNG